MKEFWRRPGLRPTEDRGLMRWVLDQFCGICSATTALHDKNCRHTDLKPENILLFEEGGTWGTLRIADVGLARFHTDITRQRKSATNAKTGTVRYEPPEMGRDKQLPRVYDVWCLGCVFLEFLIWAVYGPQILDSFVRTSVEQQFWEKKADGYHQHWEVKHWISRMTEHLNKETALMSCLTIINEGMLVPAWQDRLQVADLNTKFEEIRDRSRIEETFLLDPGLAERIANSPPSSPGIPDPTPQPRSVGQSNTSLQVPVRSDAPMTLPRAAATNEESLELENGIGTTIRVSPDIYNVWAPKILNFCSSLHFPGVLTIVF